MNIKKIPINDLLCFLEEQSELQENDNNEKTLLGYIQKHYSALKGENIPIISEKSFLEDLCFFEHGHIENNGMPLLEGLILKRKKKNKTSEYGITFRRYTSRRPQHPNPFFFYKVWLINKDGQIIEENLKPSEWQEWGLMTSYYNYPSYDPCYNKNIGQRPLSIGAVGKDVYLFQKLLYKFDKEVELTGEFDNQTLQSLKKLQSFLQLDSTDKVDKDQILIITDHFGD